MNNETNPEEKKPLEKTSKALQINLGIFLFYIVVLPMMGDEGVGLSFMAAYLHAFLLFFGGIIMVFSSGTRGTGAIMILCSLVLAVIGFSICASTIHIH